MNIETSLHEEISNKLLELDKMEVGSEQYSKAVDSVSKLMDRAIEMEKIEIECEKDDKTREFEQNVRLTQMKEDKKDRLVKNCLTGLSVIGGFGLTVWGALKSWKFEETGTVTSTAGRKFIGNLFSKK